jgi:hypothetical protein
MEAIMSETGQQSFAFWILMMLALLVPWALE